MKRMFALAAAVLFTTTVFAAGISYAVQYGGVGGRPAYPQADNPRTKSIFIYTLKDGQSAQDGVLVLNNTSEQRTIDVYAVDSELASGGAFTCAQRADPVRGVGSWIQLAESSVTLAANDNTVIPFTITAPANVDVGEHDGCIVIQDMSQTTKPKEQSGVVLGFRSAIRVAVTVPGKIVKKLVVSSVKVSGAENGGLTVTPTASNEGNVSLDTTLSTSLNPTVGTTSTTEKDGTYPVLPHSQASWNFELKRPFWGGWYRAKVTVNYDSSVQAGLGASDKSPATVIGYSGVFFSAPKPAALAVEIIILLIIVLLIAWVVWRQRHRHHIRHHWKEYKVKKNDTITSIGNKLGVPWKQLAKANHLKPPYNLESGQELRVPPSPPEKPKG